MARSKVTIRDVAALAGVSRQTVSRVINDSDRVLPQTRERVEQAILELGYEPNAVARSMARGSTGILACLAPNLADYSFACIIEGAQAAAKEHGYFVLSATYPDKETFDKQVDQLVKGGRVDGLIIIHPYIEQQAWDLPRSYPIVFTGGGVHADQEMGNSVVLDDTAAGFEATRHLLDMGHREIAMITGPLEEICVQNRSLGFERALAESGLTINPHLVIEGNWQAASGYEAFQELWQRDGVSPSAIFAQNDLMAAGVLRAATERGIEVPDQLSVIGIDDIPLAPFLSPPLTTLRPDFEAIGRQAAGLLVRAMKATLPASQSRQLLVQANLIQRRSTARCPVPA